MKKVIIFFLSLFLVSCNLNATFKNEPLEKEQAEKITSKFFASLLMKKYDNALPLFSSIFFKEISKDNFEKTIANTQKKFGNIVTWDLITWETLRVTGTNSKTEYLLIYEVEYEKYKAKETFSMIRENGSIKIVGYNVQSDGFLNEK